MEYRVAIYTRLSKEDSTHTTSESIKNQVDLIIEYINKSDNMELGYIYRDDGYSGADFNRPAFQNMMNDIRDGKINCVIVKDFSRLGRNYIESCKYIQNVFPFLGVRFISINDNYDSTSEKSDADEILIPFKNLMNDAYLRDISVKIRSQMEVKRKKGEFIGAFAVYGYQKSPSNKNKLEVDEYASTVVREIFHLKESGYSGQKIADVLNCRGELSPSEYKKMRGLNYTTPFDSMRKAKWSVSAVNRILKNDIYTGTLSQGKVTTPSHKIKKLVPKPRKDWVVIADNHQPIIRKAQFEFVQGLMEQDTRVSPQKEQEYPLSGVLFCADCGYNMVRKTVTRSDKKYIYYVCGKNKTNAGCSTHNTAESLIIGVVHKLLSVYLALLLDDSTAMPIHSNNVYHLEQRLQIKNDELHKYEKLRLSTYEDYKDGILSLADFNTYTESYTARLHEVSQQLQEIWDELEELKSTTSTASFSISDLELSKKLVANFIDRIEIAEDKSIRIIFRFWEEKVV